MPPPARSIHNEPHVFADAPSSSSDPGLPPPPPEAMVGALDTQQRERSDAKEAYGLFPELFEGDPNFFDGVRGFRQFEKRTFLPCGDSRQVREWSQLLELLLGVNGGEMYVFRVLK